MDYLRKSSEEYASRLNIFKLFVNVIYVCRQGGHPHNFDSSLVTEA